MGWFDKLTGLIHRGPSADKLMDETVIPLIQRVDLSGGSLTENDVRVWSLVTGTTHRIRVLSVQGLPISAYAGRDFRVQAGERSSYAGEFKLVAFARGLLEGTFEARPGPGHLHAHVKNGRFDKQQPMREMQFRCFECQAVHQLRPEQVFAHRQASGSVISFTYECPSCKEQNDLISETLPELIRREAVAVRSYSTS